MSLFTQEGGQRGRKEEEEHGVYGLVGAWGALCVIWDGSDVLDVSFYAGITQKTENGR